MDTFGEKLRSERKDRGLRISAVAEALGVAQDPLRALERNDFEALPDEAELMDLLRGYAGYLEVEADLMIEDFLQERDKSRQRSGTAPAAISAAPGSRLRVSPRHLALLVIAIALLVALMAWWILPRLGTAPQADEPVAQAQFDPEPPEVSDPSEPSDNPHEVAATSTSAPTPNPPLTPSPPSTPPPEVDPIPLRSSTDSSSSGSEQPPDQPSPASALEIHTFGVGTGVENRQLVGQGDRFTEGSQVAFWTRVVGGAPRDRIDHVWFREDVEVARLSLPIGSPSWRTHSTKTLYAGSTGAWAIEARDPTGRVLARSEFVCDPPL